MSLFVIAGYAVVLPVLALGFYALRKTRAGSFRLRAKLLHLFEFSMEITPAAAAVDVAVKPDPLPSTRDDSPEDVLVQDRRRAGQFCIPIADNARSTR